MINYDKVFFFLNIIIWLLIYGLLYYSFTYTNTETQIGSTVSASNSNMESSRKDDTNIESVAVDYDVNASDEAVSVVDDILSGKYSTKNGYVFNFGANGYYAGFFDKTNPSINGGSYELKGSNEQMIIRIINPDGSRMVEYNLFMNGSKGFLFVYEPTGFTLKLEKEDE